MTTYAVRFLKLSLVLLSVFSLNAESTTKSAKVITKNFDYLKNYSPEQRSLIFSNAFDIPQEPIKKADKIIRKYERGLIDNIEYIESLNTIYKGLAWPRKLDLFLTVIRETSKYYASPSKTLDILGLIEKKLNTYKRKPLY